MFHLMFEADGMCFFGAAMTWVVRLTSPDGDVFYDEAIDREGC